jgi:hypothetical protein
VTQLVAKYGLKKARAQRDVVEVSSDLMLALSHDKAVASSVVATVCFLGMKDSEK